MAFQIFKRAGGSASPKTKSPLDARTNAPAQPVSDERDPTLYASSKSTGIDVDDPAQSLSAELQTAALLFANKQLPGAAASLKEAIENEDAKSLLTWLAYLDVLRRQGKRDRFDEIALKFVVQFERSAPGWDEISTESAEATASAAQTGAVKFPIALAGEAPPSIAPLHAALKRARGADSRLSLDASDVKEIDAAAAIALTKALAGLRKAGWIIEWAGLPALSETIWKPLRAGEPRLREHWTLGLELLIWMSRERDFDDRAVDYAVTFEESPPSFEKLSADQAKWSLGAERAIKADELSLVPVDLPTEIGSGNAPVEKLKWSGDMSGPNELQLKSLLTPEPGDMRPVVINMKYVRYVDFVCAGAIANSVVRTMAAGREVSVHFASPIVKVLLLITGVPDPVFVAAKRG